MSFLTSMVSEADGSPSTMRVLNVVIVVAVIGCWSAVSLHSWQLQPLTMEQMGLILGALGIKAYQRGREGNGTGSNGDGNGNGPAKP